MKWAKQLIKKYYRAFAIVSEQNTSGSVQWHYLQFMSKFMCTVHWREEAGDFRDFRSLQYFFIVYRKE
jgi:hypothetical protein